MSAPDHGAEPKGRTMLEQDPSIRHAPLPTRKTLRRRRNPIIQLYRFALLNSRMAYIALRGHK
jgi:hypothetical protein